MTVGPLSPPLRFCSFSLAFSLSCLTLSVADSYPNTVVHGVDLSPIQPAFVPANVFFAVDDFEDDWPHPPARFDLVHMRFALWAVDDRATLLRRIRSHLKPGGFVEFQEMMPQMGLDSSSSSAAAAPTNALCDFVRYVGMGLRASRQLAGGDFLDARVDTAALLARELRAAGFAGVKTTTIRVPLGDWPRARHLQRAGMLMRTALLDGLRGWACRPLGTTAGGLGWTPTQIEIFLVDVRKAIMDPNVHAYFSLQVTYAQKPE